jgi:hypothetical protein
LWALFQHHYSCGLLKRTHYPKASRYQECCHRLQL